MRAIESSDPLTAVTEWEGTLIHWHTRSTLLTPFPVASQPFDHISGVIIIVY